VPKYACFTVDNAKKTSKSADSVCEGQWKPTGSTPCTAPVPCATTPTCGATMTVIANPGANELAKKFVVQSEVSMVGTDYQIATFGPSTAFGVFSCLPIFASGSAEGIMLSTGMVDQFNSAIPENDYPPAGVDGDGAAFQISFTPKQASRIQFRYIFASSELPKYMGSTYNDKFEMRLINTKTNTVDNIAILDPSCFDAVTKKCNNPEPDGKCHVTINNLGMKPDKSTAGSLWSPCYVDNAQGQYFMGFKGYTKELTASSMVAANTPYALNITIVDVSDGKFDSVVFLEANTFSVTSTVRRSEYDGEAPGTKESDVKSIAPSGQHSTATLVAAVVGSVVATATIAVIVIFAVLRRRKGTMDAELPAQSQELHAVTAANHVRSFSEIVC